MNNRFGLWPYGMMFLLVLIQNGIAFLFPEHPPQLVFLGIVFYALVKGPIFGLILGLVSGIYFEMFSIGSIGNPSLFLGAVGYGAGMAATKIFRDNFLIQFILPVILYYFFSLANNCFFVLENGLTLTAVVLWQGIYLKELLLLGVEAPFVFAFLKKWAPSERARAIAWP